MKINLQVKGALKTIALLFLLLAFLWAYVGLHVGVWGPLGMSITFNASSEFNPSATTCGMAR
jgi:hypothetical protein